jgi:hypothetical protein
MLNTVRQAVVTKQSAVLIVTWFPAMSAAGAS